VLFADAIVNLAGASVGKGRWTETCKQELLASRLTSLVVLHHELAQVGHHVRTVVSALTIGLYGSTADQLVTEETPPAPDFLAELIRRLEAAAAPNAALGITLVILRIGVVFITRG